MPKRNKVLIANPPASTYKGEINLGQCAYHIWLDMHYRSEVKQGKDALCHRFSLNGLGLQADQGCGNVQPLDYIAQTAKDYVSHNIARNHLHLGYDGILLDSKPAHMGAAEQAARTLDERGYIIHNGKDAYLDLERIFSSISPEELLETVDIFPSRMKKKILHQLCHGMSVVQITRSRHHGPGLNQKCNPLGPLFVLSTLWDDYNYDELVFASSSNTVSKYALLRIAISAGITQTPGMDKLYVFPKLFVKSDLGVDDLANPHTADVFRYACATVHTGKNDLVTIHHHHITRAHRVINLLNNISKVLSPGTPTQEERWQPFEFANIAGDVDKLSRCLSGQITAAKQGGYFEDQKQILEDSFADLIAKAEVILPDTAYQLRVPKSSKRDQNAA